MTSRTMTKTKASLTLIAATIGCSGAVASAQDFEAFTLGTSVNGQSGWTVEDSFGNSGELFDEAIVDDGGNQVWRISNAYTSTSYSNQPFSSSSPQIAGETGAQLFNDYGSDHTSPNTPPLSSGAATTKFFYGSWDFKSATGAAQNNLSLTVSPSGKQSTLRMSYLSMIDTGSGFDLLFYDTNNTTFVPTTVATGLNYTDWHNIEMLVEFVDGEGTGNTGNDIVTIKVDNSVVHTGTTWESYYAAVADGGIPTSAERAVDSLLFRMAGTQDAGNSGEGFYIDNVTVSNIPAPTGVALLGLGGLGLLRRRR